MSTHEIVVGLDDSRSARAALRWASDHARRTGVVLRAVHALSWPFGMRSPDLDSQAERHLSFDDVDARYRASITAVFDEINPRPDWLIQFHAATPDPFWSDSPGMRRCSSSGRRNMWDSDASSQARWATIASATLRARLSPFPLPLSPLLRFRRSRLPSPLPREFASEWGPYPATRVAQRPRPGPQRQRHS